MDIQQKKLHIFSFLVFVLLVFCFYILGGGTNTEEVEVVDTFNTSLPKANVEDLSETRLDAIYRAEGLQDDKQRLETRQKNSFMWLIEEESVPSETITDEAPVEFEEEETQLKKYITASDKLSEKERFEAERQITLERKRRELEEMLGLTASKEEKNEDEDKEESEITEVVVGRKQNKGFYSLTEEDTALKSGIRALVHGEYKNIKTGAIIKLRIIDEFTINGIHIPKNTFLYGQLSFSSSRAMIRIDNIQYKNMIIPFSASVYDQDGFQGLYTPDNMADDAKRKMANDVISSTNLNISSGIPFVSSATNAVTSAIKSISQSAIREKKLNISSNYQVNIRYE